MWFDCHCLHHLTHFLRNLLFRQIENHSLDFYVTVCWLHVCHFSLIYDLVDVNTHKKWFGCMCNAHSAYCLFIAPFLSLQPCKAYQVYGRKWSKSRTRTTNCFKHFRFSRNFLVCLQGFLWCLIKTVLHTQWCVWEQRIFIWNHEMNVVFPKFISDVRAASVHTDTQQPFFPRHSYSIYLHHNLSLCWFSRKTGKIASLPSESFRSVFCVSVGFHFRWKSFRCYVCVSVCDKY